jgi:peptidoglycan/xylan/chitin deacetylase (PgdA/CDA1 family)
MTLENIFGRANRACQRRAARWLQRRPFTIPPGRAIISFTFDDFPRSALLEGGRILEEFNAAGTYYTSLGLAGRTNECGEMFQIDDLHRILNSGHELGCHTFDHSPAWTTPAARFEAAVLRNARELKVHLPGARFRTLSYPISHPRPATKARMGRHFACCRGGGQTYNRGKIDLNYAAAFFLEQSNRSDAIRRLIIENFASGGWLIFATHDISPAPTRFGCSTTLFRDVVRFAVESGSEILTVARAWDALNSRATAVPGDSIAARSISLCHEKSP